VESFVAAVISAYRAPAALSDRVRSLVDQVDIVVVVDDGSDSLAELALPSEHVHLMSLSENRGIGHALNRGIEYAMQVGATHILTLDQDSTPEPGYVEGALRVLARAEAAGQRVAAVVPEFIGTQRVLVREGFAFDPIQAGQLIPVEVIHAVGGFREDFFIDAVDSDYTVRAEEHGLRFIIIPGAHLAHELGDLVPFMIFGRHVVMRGKQRHVLYHSPFRTYYMVRNSIVLAREHWRHRPAWTLLRSFKMTQMVAGCVLLSPDRGQQWRATWTGLADGWSGIAGRITTERLRRIHGHRRPE